MPFSPAVWAIVLLLPASLAAAEDDADHVAQTGDVKVVHARSRATDADGGVVFMDIESLGGSSDRLTAAESGVAERVEIHGAVLQDGEMASQPLDAVEIPAGGEFVLEPGAVFLKLVGLKQPLRQGEEFEVELLFAKAGELDARVLVEAADATQHSHAGHAH
jgi:copper(I)-binding protein